MFSKTVTCCIATDFQFGAELRSHSCLFCPMPFQDGLHNRPDFCDLLLDQ